MLPDPARMLADVPAALHREARGADGVWRDAVLAPEAFKPQAGDYGRETRAEGDVLYVAAPFPLPKSRLAVRDSAGKAVERWILSVEDDATFLEITLGEEA